MKSLFICVLSTFQILWFKFLASANANGMNNVDHIMAMRFISRMKSKSLNLHKVKEKSSHKKCFFFAKQIGEVKLKLEFKKKKKQGKSKTFFFDLREHVECKMVFWEKNNFFFVFCSLYHRPKVSQSLRILVREMTWSTVKRSFIRWKHNKKNVLFFNFQTRWLCRREFIRIPLKRICQRICRHLVKENTVSYVI